MTASKRDEWRARDAARAALYRAVLADLGLGDLDADGSGAEASAVALGRLQAFTAHALSQHFGSRLRAVAASTAAEAAADMYQRCPYGGCAPPSPGRAGPGETDSGEGVPRPGG